MRSRGWNSCIVGVGERKKIVAFYRWVPPCWYESAPVQDCSKFFIIIKYEVKDDINGGFLPHWVST